MKTIQVLYKMGNAVVTSPNCRTILSIPSPSALVKRLSIAGKVLKPSNMQIKGQML